MKKNYGIYLKIQINNFYGGRHNKRILEKPEVYFRAGDSGYKKEFASYYTKDFPKLSIQVRTDSAVKLYWTDEDREKMNKINDELEELKKKITLLD